MGSDGEQPSKTILVVDDDVGVCQQLAELLRCQGYRTVGLTSGSEALRFVEEQGPPGLILLDLIMPDVGGIEVLSKIHAQYPDVPICLITALYDEHLLRVALRLGAYDCVTKPMDMDYLKTAIFVKMLANRANPAAL